jgi:hypothetical protein
MFLRAATGAAVGMPFLSSLLPRTAKAQNAPQPLRFVAMKSYSGQVATQWYPTSTPAGYQLRDAVYPTVMEKHDGTTYLPTRIPGTKYSTAPLTDFSSATGISNVLGPSLNPYLPKLSLLRGLDFLPGCGHNSGGTYGNYAAATNMDVYSLPQVPTIDRVLAYSPVFYPQAPLLRALDVGTGSPGGFSWTNYGVAGGPVEEINFELDPLQAFNKAFGMFMPSNMPKVNPNVALMNAIHADYSKLSTHTRISAADKMLLERHMSFLDDVTMHLSQTSTVACTVPTAPPSIPNGYPWEQVSSIQDFKDTVRLFAEIAVAAMRCDITRVVTFDIQKAITTASGTEQVSYHNSGTVMGDWHYFAHSLDSDANAKANFISISQWICSAVFAHFCQLLDVDEGGGRTYLDNSLVCWGNELGYNHYNTDQMTLLAGSAGGKLKTGQYIDYIDWDQGYANPIPNWGVLIPGLPHNRLLVTILQAMGLQPSDYESGGTAGYGINKIIDPPYNWPSSYDMTQIGVPLPGIMA